MVIAVLGRKAGGGDGRFAGALLIETDQKRGALAVVEGEPGVEVAHGLEKCSFHTGKCEADKAPPEIEAARNGY